MCNLIDEDDDGDSWADVTEEQCGSDPLDQISLPSDHDEDGSCDVLDTDDDNDGICDTGKKGDDCTIGAPGRDRCPYSVVVFISGQATDVDSDGCEDATEDDDEKLAVAVSATVSMCTPRQRLRRPKAMKRRTPSSDVSVHDKFSNDVLRCLGKGHDKNNVL